MTIVSRTQNSTHKWARVKGPIPKNAITQTVTSITDEGLLVTEVLCLVTSVVLDKQINGVSHYQQLFSPVLLHELPTIEFKCDV